MNKQLPLVLSTNELRAMQRLFPPATEITAFAINENLSKYPLLKERYALTATQFLRSGLKFSGNQIIDPHTFTRVGEGDANIPAKGKRQSIFLTDDEYNRLWNLRKLYFPDRSMAVTVSWVIFNFSAIISRDETILENLTRRGKHQGVVLNEENSKVVSLRLPKDYLQGIDMRAAKMGFTAGAYLR